MLGETKRFLIRIKRRAGLSKDYGVEEYNFLRKDRLDDSEKEGVDKAKAHDG
jgi:hypothetical protein